MCVASRSRKNRSWLTTTTQPAKSSSASSSERIVSTSRSFVGSSMSNTLPPVRSSLASCTRLRSPPESAATRFCWSPALNPNHETYARELTVAVPSSISSTPPVTSSKTEFASVSPSRVCSMLTNFTDSPSESSPPSGASSPLSILIRVVFPAPFGPTMPTMPPGGREKDKPSMRLRPPKPLTSCSHSITLVPRRGPGGM
mmetsp:Transcript_34823/g.79000  ORF Transcript_34823/g.79000 Transcript_34823/m.79000 type:complete len:200 (-) Transcript_34823:111-710(-)